MKKDKEFYRIKEIADELMVSTTTVYKWMGEGLIPKVYKRGGRFAGYPKSVMLEAIEAMKPVQTL